VKRLFFNTIAIFAALIMAGGCIKMGPDFSKPDTGINIPGAYSHAPTERVTPQPQERWWDVFDNPELNRIVDEALRNNLDIKKATAMILEARSRFVQTRADRLPFLGFQG